MKHDALQIVYCLVTLPCEHVNEMGAPSQVLEYKTTVSKRGHLLSEWR
jgi:hypothetical protein